MARDALPRMSNRLAMSWELSEPAVVVQRSEDAASDLVRQRLERPVQVSAIGDIGEARGVGPPHAECPALERAVDIFETINEFD